MPRSALALAALATSAVPGMDVVATCAPQRVTADSQTTGLQDAAGRRWTVRAPLHPAASAQFEGELALLRALSRAVEEGSLPFDVPRIAGTIALPEGGHLLVSPSLRGRTLDLDELRPGPGLAANLGAAIAAFHELDSDVVADVGLPVYTADSYRRRCLAEVDEAARTGRVPSVLLNRWERALEDVALWRFRATPVHADLAPDQVLVANGRVTGIVTFSEVHVGDPAQDLAWLLASAPEDSLDAIVEAYVMARPELADAALLDRAMLTSEIAVARWLLHGIRTEDEEVVADATQMLDDLAADVLHAPPIGYREPVTVTLPEEAPPAEAPGGAEGANPRVPENAAAAADDAEDVDVDDDGNASHGLDHTSLDTTVPLPEERMPQGSTGLTGSTRSTGSTAIGPSYETSTFDIDALTDDPALHSQRARRH